VRSYEIMAYTPRDLELCVVWGGSSKHLHLGKLHILGKNILSQLSILIQRMKLHGAFFNLKNKKNWGWEVSVCIDIYLPQFLSLHVALSLSHSLSSIPR